MIEIQNHGPMLISSTYWESEVAKAGKYFLSVNAGAFRLLCPAGKGADLREMRTAKAVKITLGVVTPERARKFPMAGIVVGKKMIEILFDDDSDNPFALFLSDPEQIDRPIAPSDLGDEVTFYAYEGRRGKAHQVLHRPAFTREGDLPDFSA